jgi:hypothetical protein
MTRPAARRTSHVTTDKTPPAPPAEVRPEGPPPAGPASGLPWQWRLVVFLWTTSFAFLLLYEWLSGLLKAF